MKDFGKIVLASAVGFLIAQIILFIISIILFFSTMGTIMSSTSGEKFTLKSNSVLHLKLAGSIVERTSESDPFTEIMSSKYDAPMGLNDIVSAIRKAKSNDNIKGIYIDSRVFAASPATLAEIRNELKSFKESGKFIVSYSDMYTQAGYYIASVADKVAINPKGTLDIHGMASSPFFYKDALDKLGIDVQVFKVGTYKSAVEPYIQNEMSEANREQISSYLNDIWSEFRKDFAESRSMTTDEVDRLADEVPAMKQTDFLLSANLVDTLLYETEMKNYLRTLLDIDKDKEIPSADVANMKSVTTKSIKKTDNTIAILYAQGSISSGNGADGIQDKYMVSEIEKLRKDDDIKAVVFRVNSGGGSAYASEQIWKAITDLKAEKPVVVSMGDLAASGGYYISTNADKIVAQPTTITGSIGIFGMIPTFGGLTKKIGVHSETVKTNKFADFPSLNRPFNEEESAIMQQYIENGYDLFLTRCAEGRGIPKDTLAQYAQGRVWTGNQALEIGLVDELGGIEKAIDIAAEMANLGKSYVVFEYPKMRTVWEELFNPEKEQLAVGMMKEYLGDSYEMFMLIKDLKEQDYIQARLPYELNIK